MDREELLRLYAGGEKDFTGQSFGGLRDQSIRGGIYRETDFSEEEFDGASFREVDLSFADFRHVQMYESSFRKCYMEGVNFSYAVFGQVSFIKTDLTRAIFRNATLSEFGFYQVNLSYADLSGSREFILGRCENVIFYETIIPDGSICTDSV
ncbi:MAG: pentapeptide repeat-containing protein [Cyanobacteria bacterium P01_F01_bin.143]